MSQHDLTIANQGFPAFRADLNSALQALGSCQSGTSAPSPTFANQLWYDTTNNILKIRNEDNDAWISIATLDQTADSVSVLSAATVNAGALNATGNTVLGDSSTDTLNVGNGGLVKDASGNTGVGTATPTKRLDVSSSTQRGQIAMSGSNVVAIRWATTDPNSGERNWEGANNFDAQGALSFRVGTSQQADPSTTRLAIMPQGAVILSGGSYTTSGIGITFPASQSASGDANTLDDYEEGTWTPAFDAASGSATYTTQTGTYTKIGRQVTAVFYIRVNVSSSLQSQNITGLPFTGSNTNFAGTAFSIWSGIGGYCTIVGLTGAATSIQIRSTNSQTSPPVLNTLSISNSAEIAGTITYFTS
jgi:hypothetical protein